jgi:ABC-type nitrate/sulfonate/bicarbonate transport system ATPase subunit
MSPGPARIETILPIPFSRPRARSHPNFLDIRSRILKILNFGGQAPEPSYQI